MRILCDVEIMLFENKFEKGSERTGVLVIIYFYGVCCTIYFCGRLIGVAFFDHGAFQFVYRLWWMYVVLLHPNLILSMAKLTLNYAQDSDFAYVRSIFLTFDIYI